jgi:hypothetical protein
MPMPEEGAKTALQLALQTYQEEEGQAAQSEPGQPDLFATGPPVASPADSAAPLVQRGAGRPPGHRNRRTDEMANYYIRKNGGRDPLERGIEIAGMPILAPGVLQGLAQTLGCERHDAAKWWLSCLSTVLPYTHQKQAAIEVKPPGAPGSNNPVLWGILEASMVDVTEAGVGFDGGTEEGEEG